MSRAAGEEGSALVEFLALVVLLLLPILYLVLTLGRLQAASFAVEGAARDGARSAARAADAGTAQARAATVTRFAVRDQGLDPESARATVTCDRRGCGTPETAVTVEVRMTVPLPFVPAFVQGHTSVPVSARHTMLVDRHARALPDPERGADPA